MDNTNIISNSDGFKSVIDFKPFLDEQFNALTGRVWREVLVTYKGEDPDGKEYTQTVKELQLMPPDPTIAVVNDAGGNYIVNELRQFFNKHTSMGNLVNDERCRQVAVNITNNIVAEVMSSPSDYGISEERQGKLYFRMASTTRSLYMYFTAIRDGKLLDFGVQTTGSQTQITREEVPAESNTGLSFKR